MLAGRRTGRTLREADCNESTHLKRGYRMLFAIILKIKCALASIELKKILDCTNIGVKSIPVVYYYGWQGWTMDLD